MNMVSATSNLRPPLKQEWNSATDLAFMVAGTGRLYGVTNAGTVTALDPSTGAVAWQTGTRHLRNRLTAAPDALYAYRTGEGLSIIRDLGSRYEEKLLVSINPLSESESPSNIGIGGEILYMVVQEALLAISNNGDLLAGTEVGSGSPHRVAMLDGDRCVVVDGYGQPRLFRRTGETFAKVWSAYQQNPGTLRRERPVLVLGARVFVGDNQGITAYDAASGQVRWRAPAIAPVAMLTDGQRLLAVGPTGEQFCIDLGTGASVWRRVYLRGGIAVRRVEATLSGGHLYTGVWVGGGGPIHTFAVEAETGQYAWQLNSSLGPVTTGMPLAVADRLILFGTTQPALSLVSVPGARVEPGHVTFSPNPLRGSSGEYASEISFRLPVPAQVTMAAFRTESGLGSRMIDRQQRGAGTHTIPWHAGGPGGFSDGSGVERLVLDIRENNGPAYAVSIPVAVNTLPDLVDHWAREAIEVMISNKYISGYPDLTFRPDNFVTRAECSTIIAKTKDLEGPSPGFQTKFTDIRGHWAELAIMALEERDIIGGFRESDGTYTFRPDRRMTRAEEARILVKAYEIPPAPAGFKTRFVDTAGHWAKPDIDALEAAGYVRGFLEVDGTYTYRPNQPLTRAELSTLIVRILKLTRP